MTRYLIRRLALLVPVLFGVSLIVFATMALVPGDPALAILGPYATPDAVAEVRRALGLDKSPVVQYLTWLGNLLVGDFGRAYSLERPVLDEIADRLGPTLLLAAVALILSVAAGLAAGVFSAVNRGRWPDKALTIVVLLGISIPPFWLALMAVLVAAVGWGLFPVSGMASVYEGGGFLDVTHHLILPALTLSVVGAAVIARLTRVEMLEVLGRDFVRTARAKGMAERRVLWRHAFGNAVVRLLPVIGTQIGYLLGGTVYVETVFQWPGVGRMLVDAILARDLLLVQGGVLVVAALYVVLNVAVDVGQRMLDPRIGARDGGGAAP